MITMASQITSLTVAYSTVYSDADQRKHQRSASPAFVWGIHRGSVNSPHSWPVTRKIFPFDDVIMRICLHATLTLYVWLFFSFIQTSTACFMLGINFQQNSGFWRQLFSPKHNSWWRHQMEASSALLAICAGNSPVSGEFPAQRPVTRGFDVCFDLCPNKRLSKQSWGWWFETPSGSLWRHSNVETSHN